MMELPKIVLSCQDRFSHLLRRKERCREICELTLRPQPNPRKQCWERNYPRTDLQSSRSWFLNQESTTLILTTERRWILLEDSSNNRSRNSKPNRNATLGGLIDRKPFQRNHQREIVWRNDFHFLKHKWWRLGRVGMSVIGMRLKVKFRRWKLCSIQTRLKTSKVCRWKKCQNLDFQVAATARWHSHRPRSSWAPSPILKRLASLVKVFLRQLSNWCDQLIKRTLRVLMWSVKVFQSANGW